MRTREVSAGLIGLGLVAVMPMAWWLAVVLAREDLDPAVADHMIEPLDLADRTITSIGVVSLVFVGLGLVVLVAGLRAGLVRPDWLGVVLPLAVLTGYVGLTYGAATAPVSGANLGGALLLMAGFVVVPVLAVITLIYALRLRPERPMPSRRGMAL